MDVLVNLETELEVLSIYSKLLIMQSSSQRCIPALPIANTMANDM